MLALNTQLHIIPSEDPQHAVEIDDDEDDSVGDGIGEEDADKGDNDEGDDERDPSNGELLPPR